MNHWTSACCGDGEVPSIVNELESAIHEHQALMDDITQAYNNVSGLIDFLIAALFILLSVEFLMLFVIEEVWALLDT